MHWIRCSSDTHGTIKCAGEAYAQLVSWSAYESSLALRTDRYYLIRREDSLSSEISVAWGRYASDTNAGRIVRPLFPACDRICPSNSASERARMIARKTRLFLFASMFLELLVTFSRVEKTSSLVTWVVAIRWALETGATAKDALAFLSNYSNYDIIDQSLFL